MFQVGQSVICIDDTPPSAANGSDYCLVRPVKGEIYTIRGIHTESHIEGYGVYLEECPNPSMIWSDGQEAEWPFASTRFKPIEECSHPWATQDEIGRPYCQACGAPWSLALSSKESQT